MGRTSLQNFGADCEDVRGETILGGKVRGGLVELGLRSLVMACARGGTP